MGNRLTRYLRGVWILSVVSCVTACDESIDPLQSTEMAFSIFGHLEVTADTQWIRVAPFRESIFSTPDPVDAVVWIEEIGSGRRIDLEPIPFTQSSGNFGDTLYAYNFRTLEPIEWGESYRLVSRQADGSESSGFTRVPPDHTPFQTVIGRRRSSLSVTSGVLDYVRFHLPPGAHAAIVQTRIILRRSDNAPSGQICPPLIQHNPLPPPPPEETGGDIQVNLRNPGYPHTTNLSQMVPMGCEIVHEEVRVVRSGVAWPFDGGNNYTNAQAYSNIENGVGFFGGVSLETTPLDDCIISGPAVPNHCELFYGPGTSTLTVVPVNDSGFPHDYVDLGVDPLNFPFRSTVTLRHEGETWVRRVVGGGHPDPISPTHYHFPGLLPERVHIRVEGQLGPNPPWSYGVRYLYCEEWTVDLVAGHQQVEIPMTFEEVAPNEPVNANGCREG